MRAPPKHDDIVLLRTSLGILRCSNATDDNIHINPRIAMSLRTLMQAGPAKANELFAKLAETSDGAVRTREKLFTELKAELELHTSLEEQHLFPVLRRHAETKELVGEAIKDNKHLRAMLSELDGVPKNDEGFGSRLKEMQKAFKQHARDEKRELLPSVQQALSEEQILRVEGKMEAAIVAAERVRHEETESRRAAARQEKEAAARPAEQLTSTVKLTSTVNEATAEAESNVVKIADTVTTATKQVIADAADAVSSDLSAVAQATEKTVEIAQDFGATSTRYAKQIPADEAAFSRQVFSSVAERQLQLVADMTKLWIQRNDSIIQIAMTPFVSHPRP
jgi:Hemerythrin HHE cation binding domain